MTWSIFDTLCCLAARWAARNRRTRSSMVSCTTVPPAPAPAPTPALLPIDDEALGLLEDLLLAGVDFVLAWGVLEVKRVASATLRGLLLPAAMMILIPALSRFLPLFLGPLFPYFPQILLVVFGGVVKTDGRTEFRNRPGLLTTLVNSIQFVVNGRS